MFFEAKIRMNASAQPGPGRPKDLQKRSAVLAAACQLFPEHGFDGTSMDAVAATAGVSKLTVYSHFVDKETLFVAAIRTNIGGQLPEQLFSKSLSGSLRDQLVAIADAFFQLIIRDDAIALHRLLVTGTGSSPKLAEMFWQEGPQRIQQAFVDFLAEHIESGALRIEDPARAASQFFCLLKGELHGRRLCGCGGGFDAADIREHIEATVDFFLRACRP